MKRLRNCIPLALILAICAMPGVRPADAAKHKPKEIWRSGEMKVTIPSAPGLPASCPGNAAAPHCAQLTWTAATTHVPVPPATVGTPVTGPVTYDVLRSETSGGPYTKVNASPISATSFEDDTVQAGKTYFYVVTATENADPTTTSANSNQASSKIPGDVVNPPGGLQVVVIK